MESIYECGRPIGVATSEATRCKKKQIHASWSLRTEEGKKWKRLLSLQITYKTSIDMVESISRVAAIYATNDNLLRTLFIVSPDV